MSSPELDAVFGSMPSVCLDELEASAALLTRRDRKYLVPWADARLFVDELTSSSRVLEIGGRRSFHYQSVYFDTPDLVSYLGAARRRPRRFKVRTRSYLDSGQCLLEIKTRDRRGRTVKQRISHPIDARGRLGGPGRDFVEACPLISEQAPALQPVLITSYTRSTLLLPENARVTVDVDLRSLVGDGRSVALPAMAVVETKSSGAPSTADHALWGLGYRPVKVSKFCTSLSALYPTLPSNKWTQALRRPWSIEAAP